MLIFAIDDEPAVLNELASAVRSAAPDAELLTFSSAGKALEAMGKQHVFPDVVFSDIDMPGISGLAFAVELKTVSPDTRLVFVTGYSKYTLEAFHLHVHGYVMKPVTPDRIREELDALPAVSDGMKDRLQVRCFGFFEVYWNGEPVIFPRKKAKELFAFLVDRKGASCSANEIAAALWEDETDMKAVKHRIRTVISDLRAVLRDLGAENVLIREKRQLAIRSDMIDCDYYRMLNGDMQAVNAFRGTYMLDYSWAEITAGSLCFQHYGQDNSKKI